MKTQGYVIWITGISGSGKTTLGIRLKEELEKKYGNVEFIDSDEVRRIFGNDLGYTRKERIMNVKRVAFAAMLVAKNGTNVIVANIAPYYEVRDFIRENIEKYIQVYLKIPIDEVIKRDPKGHYMKYRKGQMKDIIGLDDNYDIPRRPDIVIESHKESIADSVNKILEYLYKKGV